LEDRGLARLLSVGSLEDRRRLGEVPPLEQRLPTLEELVGGLAVVGRVDRRALVGPGSMVARSVEWTQRERRPTPNSGEGVSRVRSRMPSRSAGRSRRPGLAGGPAGTGMRP